MLLIIDTQSMSIETVRKMYEAIREIESQETGQLKLDDSSIVFCADCRKEIADTKVVNYCDIQNKRTNRFLGKTVCKECQKLEKYK